MLNKYSSHCFSQHIYVLFSLPIKCGGDSRVKLNLIKYQASAIYPTQRLWGEQRAFLCPVGALKAIFCFYFQQVKKNHNCNTLSMSLHAPPPPPQTLPTTCISLNFPICKAVESKISPLLLPLQLPTRLKRWCPAEGALSTTSRPRPWGKAPGQGKF